MTERTLTIDSNEYKNLKIAAGIMTALACDEDIEYDVEDCYFDFGQDWMWTTIIKKNYRESGVLHSCQAINPKQWKEIILLESKEEMLDYMKQFI